jgi:hypothetical protein
MPGKEIVKGKRQSTFSLSKWWEGFARTLAISFLIVGALLLFWGQMHPTAMASSRKASIPLQPASRRNTPESEWGRWHKGDQGQTFPTTVHSFVSGQTIIVPNYISIRVDGVDRNWTPQPWQMPPSSSGGQDDATGKEVILVRFTIQNLSNTPVPYSDSYFSLVRANGHEQRVAALDELSGDQYGSFGQTNPWLEPGAIVHTFVPFLVNPGEQPKQFVVSWRTLDLTKTTTASSSKGTIRLPPYVNVARVAIALNALTAQATSAAPTVSAITATFVPGATFTVSSSNVYSTTP